MSVFYICYYHVVWATKHRASLITPQIEPLLFETIQHKSEQLKSPVHGINAMPDHIHIAVTIPPSISIVSWMRDVKGISAHVVNRDFPNRDEIFKWQRGYSVHSFGRKILPYILSYIENQKQHHQANTIEEYLEQLDD